MMTTTTLAGGGGGASYGHGHAGGSLPGPSSSSTSTQRPPLHSAATATGSIPHDRQEVQQHRILPYNQHLHRPSIGERSISSFTTMSAPTLTTTTMGASSSAASVVSGIESPVQSGSIANRSAHAQYGLYQQCLNLQKRLRRVPGFEERFLNHHHHPGDTNNSTSNTRDPSPSNTNDDAAPLSPTGTAATDSNGVNNDPVTLVCGCLRLGSSLAYLFNLLALRDEPLDVDPEATPANLKACKKSGAHVIMACNKTLGWPYEDMFSPTDLLSTSTNGTVKVLNTASKLLALLEERGLLLPEEEREADVHSLASTSTSLDTRGKVAKEILDSERKYVQDLEVLQEYKRKLTEDGILAQDTIHFIFVNLDEIVDFARRFLVLVEQTSSQPPEGQRFGSIFLTTEDQFSVYNKYCMHFAAASDLAASIARQENTPLSRVSHILDPIVELTMFHIKPLQRVTKYHLLWKQLLKATDAQVPYYLELTEGTAAAERVADRINEAIRKEENRMAVEELKQRVEDWKGHELSSFGDLLLQDTFQVLKGDVDREYLVFLFQKIILCCKEVGPDQKRKVNKSNSMIRKSAGSTAPGQQRRKPPLALKGRIFINNVTHAVASSKPNMYLLNVTWRGDNTEEAFGIKCRGPDQLTQWQKAVQRAVEETQLQRRSRNAGQLSARRLASPHSQFPNTPQCELGPMTASYHGSDGLHGHGSLHYTGSSASLHNPYGGTFDGDDEDGYSGDHEPSTGRSTPSLGGDRQSGSSSTHNVNNNRRGPGTQSMPASIRQDRQGDGNRPRAQTEDSNSAVIHQWRSQTPNGGYPAVPSLPRQSSGSSSQEPSLRHSASRNALRHKHSQEWSAPPMPSSSGSGSGSTVHGSSSLPPGVGRQLQQQQQVEDMSVAGGEPLRMLRQNSQGTMPVHPAPPPMRSRSASSPHVYQLPQAQGAGAQAPPDGQWNPYHQMPNVHLAHFAQSNGKYQGAQHASTSSASKDRRSERTNASSATLASTTTGTTSSSANPRLSSSSTGTDHSSGESSQLSQGLPYTSPTSPTSGGSGQGGIFWRGNGTAAANGHVFPSKSGGGGMGTGTQTPMSPTSTSSSAIKVRVHYGGDTFVIVVLSSIGYAELVDKVVHKIQLCGARKDKEGVDPGALRLRYEDEEGDRILVSADEDVAMAFDWLKTGGAPPQAPLVLYAD